MGRHATDKVLFANDHSNFRGRSAEHSAPTSRGESRDTARTTAAPLPSFGAKSSLKSTSQDVSEARRVAPARTVVSAL
jgi:hypothetical protein